MSENEESQGCIDVVCSALPKTNCVELCEAGTEKERSKFYMGSEDDLKKTGLKNSDVNFMTIKTAATFSFDSAGDGRKIAASFDDKIKVHLEKLIKFCELCPVINYFYDIFLDEAPDPQSVKELLNLFALIATLFLGSAYGLTGSVTFGELQDADERWLNQSYPVQFGPQYAGNYYADLYYSNTLHRPKEESPYLDTLSMRLGYTLNYAISLLQGVIYAIILVYVDILAKDFNSSSKKFNFVMFERWWFYARIPVLAIVVFLIISLIGIFGAFRYLYVLKFPNYCTYFPNTDNVFVGTTNQDCTYQYNVPSQYQGVWIPIIFVWIILCVGVASRYRNFRHYEKHNEEGPLSPICDILKQVVITVDGSIDDYSKKWEKKVLRGYFQSDVDNCITYEDFVNADDTLLKTLNINAHGHRKKILEITSKLPKK